MVKKENKNAVGLLKRKRKIQFGGEAFTKYNKKGIKKPNK